MWTSFPNLWQRSKASALVSSGMGRNALTFSAFFWHLRCSEGTSTRVTRWEVKFQLVELLITFPCSVLICLQSVLTASSASDIVLDSQWTVSGQSVDSQIRAIPTCSRRWSPPWLQWRGSYQRSISPPSPPAPRSPPHQWWCSHHISLRYHFGCWTILIYSQRPPFMLVMVDGSEISSETCPLKAAWASFFSKS